MVIFILLKCLFILLGVITVLVGRFLSLNIIMKKSAKYTVIDEKNYAKSCRMIFYLMGLYYVLFGIVLLFINGWPFIVGIFGTMIPALIVVVTSPNRRKYIEPIK